MCFLEERIVALEIDVLKLRKMETKRETKVKEEIKQMETKRETRVKTYTKEIPVIILELLPHEARQVYDILGAHNLDRGLSSLYLELRSFLDEYDSGKYNKLTEVKQ